MVRAFLVLLLAALAAMPAAAAPSLERFAPEIEQFEREDARRPPAPGGVLFVGGSSIRLWRGLAGDFPGLPVIQRGFGGAELEEVLHYARRIVLPYRPSVVVLYAGENDLGAGKPPAAVLRDFQAFVRLVHRELPATRIVFISVKPSPKRLALLDVFRETNARVREFAATDPRLVFLDVYSQMVDAQGRPLAGLFAEDDLHLNRRGYLLWRRALEPLLRQWFRRPAPAAAVLPSDNNLSRL